ncbi:MULTISPECIES: TetR family transcriptional regulator [unclassified Streptomyces]|uniref:TetR family transcriptional regulator n=1 Tax=unclassified Streptomyces TaxID=2593676 RepID=UPI0033A1A210
MPQPVKRKRDRAATRAALLAAARARFALRGYDATSVRDIARDAGVDPALIFRYFGSKEQLFEQAAQAAEEYGTEPADAPEDVPTRLLHAAMRQSPGSESGHPLAALLMSSGRPDCRERLNAQLHHDYVQALEQLVDLPDRELRAELLTAWLLGITVARSLAHTPALSEACVDEISPYFEQVAAVLLGTQARPAVAGEPSAR